MEEATGQLERSKTLLQRMSRRRLPREALPKSVLEKEFLILPTTDPLQWPVRTFLVAFHVEVMSHCHSCRFFWRRSLFLLAMAQKSPDAAAARIRTENHL